MNFDRSISGWQYANASFAISCNKGNTQEKLANITGIKKYFISMFEREEKYPTVKEWNIICDVLNNHELRDRGLCLIEYKRTHPDIKLWYVTDKIAELVEKSIVK